MTSGNVGHRGVSLVWLCPAIYGCLYPISTLREMAGPTYAEPRPCIRCELPLVGPGCWKFFRGVDLLEWAGCRWFL